MYDHFHALKNERGAERHEVKENILVGERNMEGGSHPRERREHEGDEILRVYEPLDQCLFAF